MKNVSTPADILLRVSTQKGILYYHIYVQAILGSQNSRKLAVYDRKLGGTTSYFPNSLY